jgi:hypothetical protein
VFKASLLMIEKIFEYVITDIGEDPNITLKLGFYANEKNKTVDVFAEILEDLEFYKERTKSIIKENIKNPMEYYNSLRIKPKVIKYTIGIFPIINGLKINYSPILYEKGDFLEVKLNHQNLDKIPHQ